MLISRQRRPRRPRPEGHLLPRQASLARIRPSSALGSTFTPCAGSEASRPVPRQELTGIVPTTAAELPSRARALDQLRNLADPPTIETETATLRQVRQSRRYQLWRVSHAYNPQVAVRLICWFPPGSGTAVAALFATDKAKMGDVFYDAVAARADPMIDEWKRETSYEEKP